MDCPELIPIAKPVLADEEIQAAARPISSGWVSQGGEVAAFEEEFTALTEELTTLGMPSSSGSHGRITGRSYADGSLFVAQGGLGKAQFGVQTQHLLDHIKDVRLAVCAGTAGLLPDGMDQ